MVVALVQLCVIVYNVCEASYRHCRLDSCRERKRVASFVGVSIEGITESGRMLDLV